MKIFWELSYKPTCFEAEILCKWFRKILWSIKTER